MMLLEPMDPKARIANQAKHRPVPSRSTVLNHSEFRVRYKIRILQILVTHMIPQLATPAVNL
jgi:hypothetical protein